MNQREYSELFADSHISDRERSLYLYLRMHMDYATGLVGAVRKICYQGIREHLEYRPSPGSKEPAVTLSRDQVKRLLRKLEGYGWIERVHNGNKPGDTMIFRLIYATVGSIRPNEERHRSATEASPQAPPQAMPVKTRGESDNSATSKAQAAPQHERHTSVTSVKDLSLYARDEVSAADIVLGPDFISVARTIVGFKGSDEELDAIFQVFVTHVKHRHKIQSRSDWLADWRHWIAREHRYEKSRNHSTKSRGAHENPTARILREAREASERRFG